ncbi:sensor histidine kinase [Actinokineospora enzanensis]|uniref:sensor histidine kinase n=1 Tax=Actinokineospora enzanensis TaxID=155975 RepID=UPI0003603CE9|nr:ATP-binding protein [Actinokineospora enzanensis]
MSSDQAGQRARPALAGLFDEATRLLAKDEPEQVATLLDEAARGNLGAEDSAVLRSVIALVRAFHERDVDEVPLPRDGVRPIADRSLVLTVTPAGSMVAAPEAVRDVLGYPPGTMDVNHMRELVHPMDLEPLRSAFRQTMAAPGTQVELDTRIRHADGRWVVLATTMINLLEATGINAVVVHARNVTERRAAERALAVERARLRELVLHLAGGVVVDDGRQVILDNPSFARIFEPDRELTGTPVPDLVELIAAECEEPTLSWDLLERLVRSARPHRGVRLALAGGRIVTCDVVPLRAAEAVGTLWYFRDITRESVARTELEETNRSLEEAAALKGRFVATVSHELRTPLTAVLAFGEMLADSSEPLTKHQAAHLEVINRNAARLLRLVDDLLLLSRLETNQLSMSFTEVDVADLVLKTTENHSPLGARERVEVTADVRTGPHIQGDPARLGQVLDNVLANALKFTQAGGSVRVSAIPDETAWTVAVSDTGIGVPAEDLPKVFEAFSRGSNAGEAGIPGSGLGLSICKEIVAVHQGSMTIESTEDVGTTVRITLPLTKPGALPAALPGARA